MTPVLTVEGLELRFGGVAALAGVSFTVEAGEVLALVGPNGAGKTSVLNCVSGVVRPTRGRILLRGEDLASFGPSVRARLGIGRTLQGLGLVDTLDVRGNLLLGRHPRMRAGLLSTGARLGRARREEAFHGRRCDEVAAQLGLEDCLTVAAGRLPPGARKRVELGRALAADPSLLLLDEPFAGAAPEEVGAMVEAIGSAASTGAGVVVVDHDVATVLSLARRAVHLEEGRVAA